ncbi:CBS domain-containing protein [Streptococcus danieliae]|nr:CBS domain-containing protein [Streptococcus danieliae]
MIAEPLEDYLKAQESTFLTPAKNLAVVIDSHNVDHVILLLSQISYTRIPVVTDHGHYVGTISLTDILSYQMKHNLSAEELESMDISHMVKRDGLTLGPDYSLTEVFHKLVDESFLPVLDDQGVLEGIIARKSILKATNALLHEFGQYYEMSPK